MEAFTCKVYNIDSAPKKIELFGDKTKKLESAQHVIEFPGGCIELSRTSDGNYWAHIAVNKDFADSDFDGMHHTFGEIIGSRLEYDFPGECMKIPEGEKIRHLAVLIKPRR